MFQRAVLPERGSRVPQRALRGIFAGRKVGWGNQLSHSGKKHRRRWLPNVQTKSVWSDALNRSERLKVTTHAIRCIDRAGGLDEYLLHTPYKKLDDGLTKTLRAMVESAVRRTAEEDAWKRDPAATALYQSTINTAATPPPQPAMPVAVELAVAGATTRTAGTSAVTTGADAAAAAAAAAANPLYRARDRSRPPPPPRVIPSVRTKSTVDATLISLLSSTSASPFLNIRQFGLNPKKSAAAKVDSTTVKSIDV